MSMIRVDIETIAAEPYNWAPIATFSGTDKQDTIKRAIAFVDALCIGPNGRFVSHPAFRLHDGAGEIGSWDGRVI